MGLKDGIFQVDQMGLKDGIFQVWSTPEPLRTGNIFRVKKPAIS